jgi:hypothetical protein
MMTSLPEIHLDTPTFYTYFLPHTHKLITAIMVAVGKNSVFLGWAAAQGIETPLDLSQRSDGRCMICRESIRSTEDELLRVPLSACITADSLESLAERLAYERNKGQQSRFAPYIDVLPTLNKDDGPDGRPSLLSLPRFWSTKRLEMITDGGQLKARIQNDERKDIGKRMVVIS